MSLTPKQAAFCREYLIDLNASAAARRAGYSPKTADRVGHQNLKKLEIATEIQEAMQKRSERTQITADRVLTELARLAFSNLLDFFRVTPEGEPAVDLTAATREQAAALTELMVEDFKDGRADEARDVRRVKIKMADKRQALELLGRHLGLFDAKHDDQEGADALKAFVDALRA